MTTVLKSISCSGDVCLTSIRSSPSHDRICLASRQYHATHVVLMYVFIVARVPMTAWHGIRLCNFVHTNVCASDFFLIFLMRGCRPFCRYFFCNLQSAVVIFREACPSQLMPSLTCSLRCVFAWRELMCQAALRGISEPLKINNLSRICAFLLLRGYEMRAIPFICTVKGDVCPLHAVPEHVMHTAKIAD
jgi:hypothetical protein